MKSYLKTFTPDECIKLLENTTFQRPLDEKHVQFLVGEYKSGRWRVNGETIILNGCKVLDGQHRLWACVQSGVPFESFVVEGVPDKAFDTMDTGKARSGADVVHIALLDSSISAPLRKSMASAHSIVSAFGEDGRANTTVIARRPTNHDIVEFVKKHPDFVDDARMMYRAGKWPFSFSIALGIYTVLKPGFPNAWEMFFSRLITDVGHQEGSPILALRRKGTANPSPPDFTHRWDVLANVIKAWNVHTAGETVKVLRYSAGAEAFPTLRLRPGQKIVNRFKA